MLLGCIGDDFPGSGDIANTLARRGMRVTQYTGVPAVHNPYQGPAVSARTLEKAVYAMEELEETARLAITLTGRRAATLDTAQIAGLIKTFNID